MAMLVYQRVSKKTFPQPSNAMAANTDPFILGDTAAVETHETWRHAAAPYLRKRDSGGLFHKYWGKLSYINFNGFLQRLGGETTRKETSDSLKTWYPLPIKHSKNFIVKGVDMKKNPNCRGFGWSWKRYLAIFGGLFLLAAFLGPKTSFVQKAVLASKSHPEGVFESWSRWDQPLIPPSGWSSHFYPSKMEWDRIPTDPV